MSTYTHMWNEGKFCGAKPLTGDLTITVPSPVVSYAVPLDNGAVMENGLAVPTGNEVNAHVAMKNL